MSRHLDTTQLAARNEIVAPPAARAWADHSFEMPTGVYVAMGLFFTAFVAVLAGAFRTDMGVSYGIVIAFLVAFFAIPAIFVKASPNDGPKALHWHRFRHQGISTATGHASAREATILVLALPFLIMCWAIAIATIAAMIR
jgi:hypothetical protein